MRLISWNVNGIRAAVRNSFWSWLAEDSPDILCLQETRIQPEQLTPKMRRPPGYHAFWHSGERKGYSGVATLSRQAPRLVQEGFGQPRFDIEGRTLLTQHGGFCLLNVYFPNGGSSSTMPCWPTVVNYGRRGSASSSAATTTPLTSPSTWPDQRTTRTRPAFFQRSGKP